MPVVSRYFFLTLIAVSCVLTGATASAQSAPGATSVTAPNGAGQSPSPSYSWAAVSSATWYNLWVNDATGNRIQQWYRASEVGCAQGSGSCNITPSTILSDGPITTWVQTWNEFGTGPWSPPLTASVGTNGQNPPGQVSGIAPVGVVNTATPSYSWSSDSDATWYYLWVDDISGNRIKQWYQASELGCIAANSSCSITPTVALNDGDISIWVQPWNSIGTGPWSEVVTATVSSTGGGCSIASAPSAIETTIVSPSTPVAVPPNFMGLHRGIDVPEYLPNGFSPIPAPTYPYGFTRNLRAEVDGLDDRGFWSTIEQTPGVYSWTSIDKWVQANAGHPIIWMIYGTPTFYQKHPGETSRWPSWPGIGSPPTVAGHVALKQFAQAVKARYGSQIVAFEVWNEPTFPWTGGITSYDDRWSATWAANNNQQPGFFTGSASDLANIAYSLNTANLGVPILGGGFGDSWNTGQHSVTRFLNAPVTLPGGSGTGKDHIQALSIHYYDYNFTPAGIIAQMDGYRAKLAAAGLGGMDIWGTETGAESPSKFLPFDPRAPINIQRWVLLGAAKGLKSLILYGHFSGDGHVGYLGDPLNNAMTIASLTEAFQIGGKTICNAALLVDDRVWVTTADGTIFLK